MTVAVSLSVWGSLAVGDGSREAQAAQSLAALSTLYRQRRLWSCADPGPSAHTLPSEDEKRRLHYQLQTTPPPLQSPSSQAFTPSLPPSLPPRFPSTLAASSTLQGLSQPREGEQTAKENHPSHRLPVPCSAQTERDRERWGRRWRNREMTNSVRSESTNCYLFVFILSALHRLDSSASAAAPENKGGRLELCEVVGESVK